MNDIVAGISQALRTAFGKEHRIYRDEVEQGFVEPCFFIAPLRTSIRQVVGRRYYQTHSFDIHYYPPPQKCAQPMNEAADILPLVLEYIEVGGDRIRGTKMSAEIQDGILHFFVSYDVFVLKPNQRPETMLTYTQTQRMRGKDR